MKKILLLCNYLLLSFFINAQEPINIQGTIQSVDQPVVGVTLSLLKSADSSLVKLAVSGKEGQYEFLQVAAGDYLLLLSSVGFERKYVVLSSVTKSTTVPTIQLMRNTQALEGVTVQARRPLVEARLDKMIVNVDASPSNAGANALELLEKSPGISVDRDGNISLKGKQGVIVLMDGKPTYLSGQDLANLLRSMPASQLDQVEIITQPSAKFDAAGNSGVINLKTKKSRTMGMNGSINVGYIQGIYPKSPNSFNFNYRKGKVNVFANGGITFWKGNNEQRLSRKFHGAGVTSVFDQLGNSINSSTNYNLRTGADFSLDSTTTIGVVLGGTYNFRKNFTRSEGNFFDEGSSIIDSSITAANNTKNPFKNFSGNINFKKVLNKSGRELTADLDYLHYNSTMTQFNDNRVLYPGNPSSVYLLRGVLPSDISIYSGKLDYVHPVTKDIKIEAGIKSSLVKTDNNAPYETFDEGQGKWVDDVRKDHFAYDEHISAAYVSFSSQVKKWGFQGGLRGEHTQSKGKQILIDKSVSRSYFQLFPTAYISYGMNDKNQFGLSYGRRIERPNYQDLNPFQRFLDLYTYNQGNPYLTPQFTNNIELSHIYAGRLSTTVNYTVTNDIINDILKQDNETKVTFQTKENVASRRNIGLAISYNAPVTKWWTTSLNAIGYNNYYKGLVNGTMLSTSVNSFSFNMNQQFKFAKTWAGEVSGFYQGRNLATSMFVIDPMYVISFGFSKQVLKNKGSLRLSVIDPFRLQKTIVFIDHGNLDMVVHNRWDNRRVGLSFTYRFSKGANVQQRRRMGSAQDEQNRVGQ